MSQKHGNPPAFPQLAVEACKRDGHGDLIEPFTTASGGMTLRDYFAAHAMQGLIISAASVGGEVVLGKGPKPDNNEDVARVSYELADAMLKARAE